MRKLADSVWRHCRNVVIAFLLQRIHGWRECLDQFNGGGDVHRFFWRCVVMLWQTTSFAVEANSFVN